MSEEEIKFYNFNELIKEKEQLQQENKQLKEDLRVSQSNEETYSLEMQEITKILGLDEDTLFDDVKEIVKYLNEEHNKKLKVFMAYDYYHSILRDLEEYLVKIAKNGANIEKLTCSNILVYLKELKEKYK